MCSLLAVEALRIKWRARGKDSQEGIEALDTQSWKRGVGCMEVEEITPVETAASVPVMGTGTTKSGLKVSIFSPSSYNRNESCLLGEKKGAGVKIELKTSHFSPCTCCHLNSTTHLT